MSSLPNVHGGCVVNEKGGSNKSCASFRISSFFTQISKQIVNSTYPNVWDNTDIAKYFKLKRFKLNQKFGDFNDSKYGHNTSPINIRSQRLDQDCTLDLINPYTISLFLALLFQKSKSYASSNNSYYYIKRGKLDKNELAVQKLQTNKTIINDTLVPKNEFGNNTYILHEVKNNIINSHVTQYTDTDIFQNISQTKKSQIAKPKSGIQKQIQKIVTSKFSGSSVFDHSNIKLLTSVINPKEAWLNVYDKFFLLSFTTILFGGSEKNKNKSSNVIDSLVTVVFKNFSHKKEDSNDNKEKDHVKEEDRKNDEAKNEKDKKEGSKEGGGSGHEEETETKKESADDKPKEEVNDEGEDSDNDKVEDDKQDNPTCPSAFEIWEKSYTINNTTNDKLKIVISPFFSIPKEQLKNEDVTTPEDQTEEGFTIPYTSYKIPYSVAYTISSVIAVGGGIGGYYLACYLGTWGAVVLLSRITGLIGTWYFSKDLVDFSSTIATHSGCVLSMGSKQLKWHQAGLICFGTASTIGMANKYYHGKDSLGHYLSTSKNYYQVLIDATATTFKELTATRAFKALEGFTKWVGGDIIKKIFAPFVEKGAGEINKTIIKILGKQGENYLFEGKIDITWDTLKEGISKTGFSTFFKATVSSVFTTNGEFLQKSAEKVGNKLLAGFLQQFTEKNGEEFLYNMYINKLKEENPKFAELILDLEELKILSCNIYQYIPNSFTWEFEGGCKISKKYSKLPEQPNEVIDKYLKFIKGYDKLKEYVSDLTDKNEKEQEQVKKVLKTYENNLKDVMSNNPKTSIQDLEKITKIANEYLVSKQSSYEYDTCIKIDDKQQYYCIYETQSELKIDNVEI